MGLIGTLTLQLHVMELLSAYSLTRTFSSVNRRHCHQPMAEAHRIYKKKSLISRMTQNDWSCYILFLHTLHTLHMLYP